jgi:predicted permease
VPTVPDIVAPLFGVIFIGVLAGSFRLFDEEDARVLSRLVFQLAMPLAVLEFMSEADPPSLAYAGLILGYLGALAIIVGLAFWIARRSARLTMRESGAAVFATTCGNAVFLGLPIALAVPGWASPFLILMIFEGIFVFGIGSALMTWPEREGAADQTRRNLIGAAGRAFRNPIVLATLVGMLMAVASIDIPPLLAGPVFLFGRIASPLGLFVLGLYLALLPQGQSRLPTGLLGGLLPLKLVLFPLLAGGFVYALTGDERLTTVAALFTAMPPAVASVILSATYRQLEAETAAIVAVGTMAGLATVTMFLSRFLPG